MKWVERKHVVGKVRGWVLRFEGVFVVVSGGLRKC